jgi:hypothetical protein
VHESRMDESSQQFRVSGTELGNLSQTSSVPALLSGGTVHTEDHIVLDTGETSKWGAGPILILSP